MDAVERVFVALPQIHGASTQRVLRTAWHSKTALQLHHVSFEFGFPLQHFRRRVSVGPFQLVVNGRSAGPDETFSANAHPIANGLSTTLHQI